MLRFVVVSLLSRVKQITGEKKMVEPVQRHFFNVVFERIRAEENLTLGH
jgi:hypothetical protein